MRRIVLLVGTLFVCSIVFAQQPAVEVLESGYIFEQAPFKACHAATVVQPRKGPLLAAWFGGDHEGANDVCIWFSSKTTTGWTAPRRIADGLQPDGRQYPCWNPVLFEGTDKKIYMHYKVGPNPREWWALYKTSADGGKTWSNAIPLPEGFLGPIKNKPVLLKNDDVLYPSSTESLDEKQWLVHLEVSDSKLNKWTKITIDCDTFGAIQPSILHHPNNKLQLLARTRQNMIAQSWSTDGGKTWSPLEPGTLPNPNSGVDAATLPGNYHLLVYNPLPAGKNWWEGRSILKLAGSHDGIHWQDLYTFEDHKEGEYSYPAIVVDQKGIAHVVYTDKRSRIKYFQLKVSSAK